VTVQVSVRNRVGVITIDRPEVRNAMDRATSAAMSGHLREWIDSDEVRVVVVTGSGDVAFCAGADLRVLAQAASPAVASEDSRVAGFGGLTRGAYPKPVIAAVNGMALGGGWELVLACDLAVAAENATFALPEVRRGLVPGGGAAVRLSCWVSPTIARELLLFGETCTAQRALELGLVNRLAPHGQALEAALAMADRLASMSPRAIQTVLGIERGTRTAYEREAFEVQDRLMAGFRATEDRAEALRAFAEKREPVWRNR
jgi:enoyl-CoA hydratase/carnithine racemase